jgi:hypothetical protein
MIQSLALRRFGHIVAAISLATTMSIGPLLAAGNNATSADGSAHKSSKKIAKSHKVKRKPTEESMGGSGPMSGYRPDIVSPGNGY